MNLFSLIKPQLHEDAFGELWLLEGIKDTGTRDVFSYRLIKRKWFFFYSIENEWIHTGVLLERNTK